MRVRLFLGLTIILVATAAAFGQTATGTPAFGSFSGSGFDTIDAGNMNVHFDVPLINKAGRGLPFHYNLSYDSSIWAPVSASGSQQWTPVDGFGWRIQTDALAGEVKYKIIETGSCFDDVDFDPPQNVTYHVYEVYAYLEPNGNVHPFTADVINYPGCNPSYQSSNTGVYANDASGYSMDVSVSSTHVSATVYPPSGGSLTPPINTTSGASTVVDSNGNEITSNGSTFIDTLGTTALTISGTAPSQVSYQYTNVGGGTTSATISYGTYTVQTAFNCSGIGEYNQANVYLPVSISLQDGTSYSFTYEQPSGYGAGYTTGRIASVTLPSGGTISYSYGINCIDGSAGTLHRTTPDSLTAWQYSQTLVSPPHYETTITDPLGNQTLVDFLAENTNAGSTYLESNRKTYSGTVVSGTLLKTVMTCYNNASPNPDCTASTFLPTLPISQVDTYTELPDSSGKTSQATTKYDNLGNVTETDAYDFGAAPRTLLQKVTTTYWFYNRPKQINVYSSGANPVAQTTYTYDEGTVSPSGASQLVAPMGNRGNPTTISRMTQGTTTLTSHVSYYDTGMPYTVTDINGAVTTYTYSAAGSCNYSLPTTTTLPLNLSRTATWNCNGAVPTATQDENQKTTNYTYDNAWRVTDIAYPDGGETQFNYIDANTVEEKHKQGTSWTDAKVRTDSLGRAIRNESLNGEASPNNWDQTDTCYDALGRVSKTTYAYTGDGTLPTSATCTAAADTYGYDALGRPTSVQHSDGTSLSYSYSKAAVEVQDEGNGNHAVKHVSQLDAVGRTTAVCEVTGVTLTTNGDVPADCGLDISETGFKTAYAYDPLGNLTSVIQGNQTRTYTYDGLSRLLTESNPELPNATVSYSYDGTNAIGDLYQITRPKQNQTSTTTTVTATYAYDALHRVTSSSYDDGSTTHTFSYDGSATAGFTLNNAKGRLTSSQISGTSGATNYLSYDPMGRVANDYQCTPSINTNCSSTGQYRGLAYSYDTLGQPASMTYPDGTQLGYTYNVAGRLTAMTSTHSGPSTLVSNVHYNAFGAPVSDALGNSVNDSFSYNTRGMLTNISATTPGAAATPGSGSFTISGTERSIPVASPGTGSVTVNGSEQSKQVLNTAATHATGTVTISGSIQTTPHGCWLQDYCIHDSGDIWVAVNGVYEYVYYDGTTQESGAAMATAMANAINGDANFPATASASSGVVTLTSKGTGASQNMSLAAGNDYDTVDFTGPSYSFSRSGSTLTGGQDATYSTVYDSGTTTITVNGHGDSANWGQGSTTSGIATALANSINGDSGASVTASVSGSTVNLTAKTAGSATNYSLSSGSTFDSGDFASSSFSTSNSGANLTGGNDDASNIYDTGTVSATVNGRTETVNYGQSDTPSTLATALASAFNNDAQSFVTANASSGTVTVTAKTDGASTNYAFSTSGATNNGNFTGTSFTPSPSSSNLTGGTNQGVNTIYSVVLGYEPNGAVASGNDSVNGNWTYGYDDFNRLLNITESGSQPINYSYDRYGNRWIPNGTGGWNVGFSTNYDNHIDGGSYDADGNLTSDGTHTYTLDAENRIIGISGGGTTASYLYDPAGRRVQQAANSTTQEYVYDLMGHAIAAYDTNGNVLREEVYAGGTHVATYANSTTYFAHTDWLGTERVRTNASGTIAVTCTGLPFGDSASCAGTDASPLHYTGLETDSDTGLSHAIYRYYSPGLSRWITPDPAGTAAADLTNPQSLNRYAYVTSNPTGFADPTGLAAGTCFLVEPDYEPSVEDANLDDGCVPDYFYGDMGGMAVDLVNSSAAAYGVPRNISDNNGGVYHVYSDGSLEQLDPSDIAELGGDASYGIGTPFGPDPAGHPDNGSCLKNVGQFVNAHVQDARTLANGLGNGVTPAEVLAVAGNETGYGGGFAKFGNFFGLHGSGPAGTYYTAKNHTPVAMFPVQNGFLLSGQEFVRIVGPYMQPGMGSNPLSFFSIINQHGYATGNSDYPAYMVATGRHRGPYTQVSACMEGN